MFRMRDALLAEESGVTMIEYAFLAALIALALVTTLTALGTSLQPVFTTIGSAL